MSGRTDGARTLNDLLKRLCMTGGIMFMLLVGPHVALAQEQPPAPKPEPQGFSSSNVQILYGWNFNEPGLSTDVPKNIFTFENTAAWSWGSSYLFVDILRSWSDADVNAKEVYGEWYPSVSLRKLSRRKPSTGLLRDVSATLGLNSGVRSTGPAPFVVLPGATFDLHVPGFAFVSVATLAYIDRGRFEGQPTGCAGTTYQVTPSWSLPFTVGGAPIGFEGFVDFIGSHAECKAMVLSQPKLKVDISALWHKPGKIFLGVEWDYWHNKYGIQGLHDNVWLPLFVWKL
jgi:nucleoside-specific outer membrane channel protein Tsx